MRGYIFDLDGTVYLGEQLIPGADEAIAALRQRGDQVVFLSNKPIATRESYVKKLNRMGIPVNLEDVLNSSLVAARYLQSLCHPREKVLVVGEEPICKELIQHGISLTEDPEEARYVLLSWDRGFTYEKLTRVFQAWMKGAEVIASNPDRTCPTEKGLLPDTGGIIGALEGVTGKPIQQVVGKPSSLMAEVAVEQLGVDSASCFVVGDRLETDIRMGNQAGMTSVLVLTGVSTREEAYTSCDRPRYIVESIAEVVDLE